MTQTSSPPARWPHACVSNAGRVVCPICGPGATDLVGTSLQFPVCRYCGCSLLFVSECPDPNETNEFFREKQITNPQSTKTAHFEFHRRSLKRGGTRIRNLIPGGRRLLDVGTASAFFLRPSVDHPGWKTAGVEPSRVPADHARRMFGLNFFDDTRETRTCPAGPAGFQFVESHPAGMPTTSRQVTLLLHNSSDAATGALERLTNGRWNFSAKELCNFRKPRFRINTHAPSPAMAPLHASLQAA